MSDQELHAFCEEWRRWALSRKFFLEPGAQNLLARMVPSKTGREPDARLSADLSYFNMALHALADMEPGSAECFVLFYCRRVKDVKAEAHRLGIHRNTFYERKRRFARRAYALSLDFRDMNHAHQAAEPEAESVD